jgi:5-formyltetrahydrofolate cyclo-ligase
MAPIPEPLRLWRRTERERLIAARLACTPQQLAEWQTRMDGHVLHALQCAGVDITRACIGFCWPYMREYDARGLVARLRAGGARAALPVVVAPKTPLVFRAWDEATVLADGPLGIPYPADSPEVTPDLVLLPVVGFDEAGYRLGYGGGYFDRTLAALPKRPLVIGTAYELLRLPSIQPQEHDIPLDWVVTEAGAFRREAGRLVAA